MARVQKKWTPLHIAAHSGHANVIKALLAAEGRSYGPSGGPVDPASHSLPRMAMSTRSWLCLRLGQILWLEKRISGPRFT